jgi:DNA polymerase III delta prime subunit
MAAHKSLVTYHKPPDGPLTERQRPRTLDMLFGQDSVVAWLRNFAANPYPAAFIFDGETGTGKTSAALCLAAAIGCDVAARPQEFGGVHVVASGEQTADTVRDLHRRMWQSPFSGSGWKVVIVNESDRMHQAVEPIWLDRLEQLPPRTVIVFTTNYPAKLSQRFRDRCGRIAFEGDAAILEPAAIRLAEHVWKEETGKQPRRADRAAIRRAVAAGAEDGMMSFRRVVQAVQKELMTR